VQPSLNLTNPIVSSTGISSANLVILPFSMQTGLSYTYRLSASADGFADGFAEVSVRVNSPPVGGLCNASESAVATQALTIQCTGWSSTQLPLQV